MTTKNKKAFTLIECLISILILAILLAGGMSFYFNSNSFMSLAMHKKIALELATEKMEDCKRVDCLTSATCANSLESKDNWPGPGESISVGGLNATRWVDVCDPADPNAKLFSNPSFPCFNNAETGYKVAGIIVRWTEAGKDPNTSFKDVDLVTYIQKQK